MEIDVRRKIIKVKMVDFVIIHQRWADISPQTVTFHLIFPLIGPLHHLVTNQRAGWGWEGLDDVNVYCLWASKVCKKETRTEHDCDKSNTNTHHLDCFMEQPWWRWWWKRETVHCLLILGEDNINNDAVIAVKIHISSNIISLYFCVSRSWVLTLILVFHRKCDDLRVLECTGDLRPGCWSAGHRVSGVRVGVTQTTVSTVSILAEIQHYNWFTQTCKSALLSRI